MTQFRKILAASVLLILLLIQTSCNADLSELTEGEVVEIIESALQNQAGGLTTNIEDIVSQLIHTGSLENACDSLFSSTVGNDYNGAQVQGSYTTNLNYEITCNSFNVPQTAIFSSTTIAMLSSTRITSNDDATFSGSISGLQPSASTILMQGDYSKTGTQEINITEQRNLNSTLTADLTDIEIDKQSFDIASGLGTFTFSGTTQDSNFSYSGSIVFNGNGTATLTINGTPYIIDLN